MAIRYMAILFLLLIIVACSELPVDNTAAPIPNNLYLLEMRYDGRTDSGLLGAVESFDTPPRKYIYIPVWNDGLIQVDSQRCNFSQSYRYEGTKDLSFNVQDLLEFVPSEEFGCIFDIFVFVDGLDRGIRGQFHLVKDEFPIKPKFEIFNRKFEGVGWYQMKRPINGNTTIKFKETRPGLMFWNGCGVEGELRFQRDPEVKLEDLVVNTGSCFVTFGFIYDGGGRGVAEVNLKFFSDVLEIPDPTLDFNGKTLKIGSAEPIGYVSIDKDYNRGTSVSERIDGREVIVRLMTANGRYKIFKFKNGRVTWRPSIRY